MLLPCMDRGSSYIHACGSSRVHHSLLLSGALAGGIDVTDAHIRKAVKLLNIKDMGAPAQLAEKLLKLMSKWLRGRQVWSSAHE